MKIQNNILKNLNKPIYIASKDAVVVDEYNNEIVTYSKPFKLGNFNYQPLTGSSLQAYVQAYGETKQNIVKVFLDVKYKNLLKELDLAYLYGSTPKKEKINGNNANYIVRTKKEQNLKIMVIFEEIIKEG